MVELLASLLEIGAEVFAGLVDLTPRPPRAGQCYRVLRAASFEGHRLKEGTVFFIENEPAHDATDVEIRVDGQVVRIPFVLLESNCKRVRRAATSQSSGATK